jgi:kinesin family protein 1
MSYPDPMAKILGPENTNPPANGVAPESPPQPRFMTTITQMPKNPTLMKGGYLLAPNSDSTRWIKRFVELRRPYLHIHNVTDGDEVAIVSLRNSRVDSQPGILGLLGGNTDAYNIDGPDSRQPSGNGTNNAARYEFRPGHRRTSSGRLISTIWTGTGAGNPNGKPGLARLSEQLQQGMFAIYGTDNTWLFAARSEREKLDWIFRIDQSYLCPSESASGNVSRSASPRIGAWPGGEGRDFSGGRP